MNIPETHVAWLAGLWDGEGSVGISQSFRSKNVGTVLVPQLQVEMTHQETVLHAARIFEAMLDGAFTPSAYPIRSRQRTHAASYGFNITRTGHVLHIARALWPHSVTKQAQWLLVEEFCRLRIERQGVDEQGRLRRGGAPGWWTPYSDREREIYEELRALNARGEQRPSHNPRTARVEGRVAAEGVAAGE